MEFVMSIGSTIAGSVPIKPATYVPNEKVIIRFTTSPWIMGRIKYLNFHMRNTRHRENDTTEAIPTDINIPYAPKVTRTKGRTNFTRLQTVFFMSTYTDDRYAIKTFSAMILREEHSMKKTNKKEENSVSLIKSNVGENIPKNTRYKIEASIEVTATIVKEVLIFSFFLSDVGRYFTKLFPNPKRLKVEINVITEMSVVPIPTCSGVNSRAFTIQKKNPKKAMIAVLAIKKIEFLYRESLATYV